MCWRADQHTPGSQATAGSTGGHLAAILTRSSEIVLRLYSWSGFSVEAAGTQQPWPLPEKQLSLHHVSPADAPNELGRASHVSAFCL